MNVPIVCGGVAVYPGDIIVGDVDRIVAIPQHLIEEVAIDATEQERMEDFIMQRINAPLRRTYPQMMKRETLTRSGSFRTFPTTEIAYLRSPAALFAVHNWEELALLLAGTVL
jgi:hypothetical protein